METIEKVKKKRYKTIKAPFGYKIIKQSYLGETEAGEVNSIRVFFERRW